MKKLFLLLFAAFLSSPSLAADMPIKAAPYSPSVPSWSGVYLGLEGGMNLGNFSPFCRICGEVGTEINLDDNNWFIGGHIGYALQRGQIVFGPEVGVQYWAFKGKANLVDSEVSPTLQTRVDWLAYANMRVGITPVDRVLIYLTGGPAWAHVKGDVNINLANIDLSNDQSVFGYNIGGGIAFKITDTVVFGGEYRHYDFGKVSAANPVLNLMGIGTSDRLTTDQAMARLSFRFTP